MRTTTAAAPDENMEIDSRTLTPAASSLAPPEDTLPAPFSGPLTRARAHELNFVRVEPPPNRDLSHSPKDRALPLYQPEAAVCVAGCEKGGRRQNDG
jgi:hypothetical protein